MPNPYESPSATNQPVTPPSVPAGARLTAFFAWYAGAFVLSAAMWHLSAYFRAIDLLEIPLTAFHFPLAGFLDPHDGMVQDSRTFYYAVVFWVAVIPVALRFAPRRVGPLLTALAIIAVCAAASMAYVVAFHLLGWGR